MGPTQQRTARRLSKAGLAPLVASVDVIQVTKRPAG